MFALITDCNQIKQDNVVDMHDFVDRYGISLSQMTTIMLRLPKSQSGRFFHSWLVTGFVTRVTSKATQLISNGVFYEKKIILKWVFNNQ
jgi:hypothetical protein